ncbi:UPF0149 family protein [Novosphingobium naphthalenivorans]|uniref:UPF0149 family protein n=1 Tax=Novosphingobium naphthalenivorans TaxID=273168 RepID=UPI00082A650F|nr:UPF0149 family protein [Novosphingobium naphthalenivorans]
MASLYSYLDELDQLLLNQPDDCMLLSQLDGFLAGVIVSPDLILPGQWLKVVWGGGDGDGAPDFADTASFQHALDLIMHHYHTTLASLDRPGAFEPVFEEDTQTGETLWELWVEGFCQAMDLAPDGWERIAVGGDPGATAALAGFMALKALDDGRSGISRDEEDQWDREAPDLIPMWVEMLHEWRRENDPNRHSPVSRAKVGRNDPCPCGSGKKYKKCCGLN